MHKLFAKYLLWWSGNPASPRPSYPSTEGRSQFCCDRVAIVCGQNSKKLFPSYLKERLCLTVYQAKGLEFDGVILFKFYLDSKCGSQSKILNEVRAKQEFVKVITKKFIGFEELDCTEEPGAEQAKRAQAEKDDFGLVEEDLKSKDGHSSPHSFTTDQPSAKPGKEFQAVLSLTRDWQEIYRKYPQVCTELKLLYVVITRPR